MAFNIRRVGAVAPNSVGFEELKVGAVPLDSDRVTSQLPGEKIQPEAIDTGHIRNLAITAIKAANDVKLKTYVGDETETEAIGLVPFDKEFNFVKNNNNNWQKIRIIVDLKTSNASYPAICEAYMDIDTTSFLYFESISDSEFEIKDGEYDISGLGSGKHKVTVRLVSSDESTTAYSDFLDVGLIP